MQIEQGPIRPPSEASSLLIRITRNCPWNKCAFCKTYKRKQFSRRTMEEILQDIDTIAKIVEQLQKYSWDKGLGGKIDGAMVNDVGSVYGFLYYHVAQWLYTDSKNVFLQDANSILLKTEDLVKIIKYLRQALPMVERITTYARANTVARKSLEELQQLNEAGLIRIHMGMESGSDVVLKMIQKGISPQQLIDSAQKARAAGISLCMYVMPGLGGKQYSREHALGTAEVINAGNPDFMRFRTTSVLKNTALYDMMERGEFIPLEEDEIVQEQRLIVESLNGINTTIVSDHILNLLQELEGRLPDDKEKMLNIIDRYLTLPADKKANYQLGRRAGFYSSLDDMNSQNRFLYVESMRMKLKTPEEFNRELLRLRTQYM